MGVIDWTIIVSYLLAMIGLSVYLGRKQSSQDDYYLAGRNMSWWAIGISTMATQTSAISFISKPAFVALKEGGGLTLLQFELAVPLAMIVVIAFLIPFFRSLELISVYEYLELRFDASVRYLVSGAFLVSRGLAAGVVIYTTAIVLAITLEIPLYFTILIIGIVTVVYDTIGGMAAVIYSDVIQLAILLTGIFVCIFYAADIVGGLDVILTVLPQERLNPLSMETGLGDNADAPFWGIFLGGFFLYISYYGTDQSQVQRELSAESSDGTIKSLMFNGLARFPLTLMYAFLGMAVYAVYLYSPELQSAVASRPKFDYLIPEFILMYIPTGLRAILFAAIFAATMSSLDSTLNSLSAATMRDFVSRLKPNLGNELLLGKITTVIWGTLITCFALLVQGGKNDTVFEIVNQVGSVFYGPIVAAFLVGVLSKRVNSRGIFSGIIIGVGFNIYLWLYQPTIYWMWWNMVGCLLAGGIAWLASLSGPAPSAEVISKYTLDKYKQDAEKPQTYRFALLAIYFILMLGFLYIMRLVAGDFSV